MWEFTPGARSESTRGKRGGTGKNWDFSWGAHFTLSGSLPCDAKFSRGDGRRDVYSGCQLQGSEYVFTTLPAGYVDIKTSVVTSASEIRQTKRNGFKQVFDQTTGKLKTREDRYGNKLTVYYDASGRISIVNDTLDRTISFSYGTGGDANAGRLTAVTDFANRSVNYEYTEAWTNGPIVLAKVTYPATDWLDDTTDPWTTKTNTSRKTEYKYDSSYALLTQVLDGRGKERMKADYDSLANGQRVTKQYNYSPGGATHSFAWTLTDGKVSVALWTNRSGNERRVTFDPTKHLSTKYEVRYTPEGGSLTWVETLNITRGCTCTLPTAIEEADHGYTTFTIDSNGNVTEKRDYFDNDPSGGYTTTAGSDLVHKAYFASVAASQFGACTKVVGPKAFTATPNEAAYSTLITYDYSGNPITIAYPDTTTPTQTGHTETRTYNSNGQLLTVSRPEGMLTTYAYYDGVETPTSNKGYLKEVKVKYRIATPPDSTELITTYKYSNYGARTSVKDPLARETTYVVDSEFLVKQVTTPSPFSYIKELHYNGERQLVREKLENRKGTGARDTDNPWWEIEYEYGTGGELLTKWSEVTYSPGTQTITWEALSFAYDNDFRRTLARDGREKQTRFLLDERGLTTEITRAYASPASPDESKELLAYDEEGKLSKTTRPFLNPGNESANVITRITFDRFDRREYVYDGPSDSTPDNYTRFFYDLASMVTSKEEWDSSSTRLRLTKHSYDELDRLEETIRGTDGEDTTTFEYDKASRRTKTTDDNSNATAVEYDLAARPTKTFTPSLGAAGQNYTVLDYDLNGNVVKRTSHEVETLSPYASADFVWEMEYDELNRRTKTTFKGSDGATGPNPVETVNTLDTRNLLIKSTDSDGVPTEHEYDGLGRRTKTTINIGGAGGEPVIVLLQGFDGASNLTSRTDDEGKVTSYSYDDQNRLTTEQVPGDDWIKWIYNDLSLPVTKAWGHGTAGRQTLSYRYDHRGLLTKKTVAWAEGAEPSYTDYANYKTTEETFSYDGVSRLTNANDEDAKVTFVWNPLDQVTAEKLNINLRTGCSLNNYPASCVDNWKNDKTTTTAWDPTGRRRTSVTYPITGKTFNYTHDALDRVTQLSHTWSTKGLYAEYKYEGPGLDVLRRDRWLDLDEGTNTFRTSYTDDPLKRLTEIKHERDTGSSVTLSELDYTWGNGSSGKIWQRARYDISGATTVNHDYLYDKIGRLSKDTWEHTTPDEEYKFTLTDTQFLSKIEKTPLGGATTTVREFTKAGDGSLQMTGYSNPTTTCSFDVAGNMTGEGSTSYRYDHENRLIHIDGTTDFWFRYDALGRRVVEKEGSTERLFYYDGLHIIEETDSSLGLNRLSLFGIQLDELLYSGDVDGSNILTDHHWPLTDHLGSVIRVLDNSAGLLANFDYTSAYGEATVTGTDSTYPYGFTGRRRILGALPLYDYRTRVYEPGCGRFLQRDPVHDANNHGNPYAYTGNNPLDNIDPLGLFVAAPVAAPPAGVAIAEVAGPVGWCVLVAGVFFGIGYACGEKVADWLYPPLEPQQDPGPDPDPDPQPRRDPAPRPRREQPSAVCTYLETDAWFANDYENCACPPPRKNIYVCTPGRTCASFDGIIDNGDGVNGRGDTLLECKDYPPSESFLQMKLPEDVAQATRQVIIAAACGNSLEWRYSNPTTVEMSGWNKAARWYPCTSVHGPPNEPGGGSPGPAGRSRTGG